MQNEVLIKKLLICIVFFTLFPGLSWAASSLKGGATGTCCVGGTLKEASAKVCEKYKGTYYAAKDQKKAQKECRSEKPSSGRSMIPVKTSIPGKVVVPAKRTALGYCCVDGVLKKSNQSQCSKMKGSYYTSSSQAKKSCKPKKVFCCVNGKIGEMSLKECKKRKGTSYATLIEARKKCKPTDIYCCVDGKVSKASAKKCKQRKGKEFVTRTEANRVCRQMKSNKKASSLPGLAVAPPVQQVKGLGGKSVGTQMPKVPGRTPAALSAVNGYCCVGGKVSSQNKKECERKRGDFFSSRIAAEKSCRAKKAGAASGKATKKGQSETIIVVKPGAQNVTFPVFLPSADRPIKGGAGPSVQLSEEAEAQLQGRSNWSLVSGRVIVESDTTGHPVRGQVYATLIGRPSPQSDETYITTELQGGSYQLYLPPSSNWEVNVLPTTAFHFEEMLRGYPVYTPGQRVEFPKSFLLRLKEGQSREGGEMCRVNGSVLIDGEAVGDFRMAVHEMTAQGWSTERRDFPVQENRFVFFVPSGDYRVNPLFRADSPYFNLVPPKDFTCNPEVSGVVSVQFDTNRVGGLGQAPENNTGGMGSSISEGLEGEALTVFEGTVTMDAPLAMRGILKVRLEKVGDPGNGQEMVPDYRTGAYRFSVLADGARYLIKVDVDENYGEGSKLWVHPTEDGIASIITQNFEIQLPAFQVEPHLENLRTITQENGRKRYNFDLRTVSTPSHGNKKYSREVTVRANRSGVAHTRMCDFGRDTTCSFSLPATGMSPEDSVLEVRVAGRVSFEQGYAVDIPVALKKNSDLVFGKITLIEERPSRGSAASGYSILKDIQLVVKNVGGAQSKDLCAISMSVNGIQKLHTFKVLEPGKYRSLLMQVEELEQGDVITATISDQCDDAPGNNSFRYVVPPGDFRIRRN